MAYILVFLGAFFTGTLLVVNVEKMKSAVHANDRSPFRHGIQRQARNIDQYSGMILGDPSQQPLFNESALLHIKKARMWGMACAVLTIAAFVLGMLA